MCIRVFVLQRATSTQVQLQIALLCTGGILSTMYSNSNDLGYFEYPIAGDVRQRKGGLKEIRQHMLLGWLQCT